MKLFFVLLFFICCINITGAQTNKAIAKTYHLIFQNTVSNSALHFDSIYQNHFGEAFTVRSCKYYISRIQLQYNDGKQYFLQTSPHLVNEADSVSKSLFFTAPSGVITGIQFLLGIDSLTNTTGVQTGDLDPAKGMFWIWNTGYIMAKLEGSSPSSKAPQKGYSYDIGGYKQGESAARKISLLVPSTTNHQPSTFIISADINKWFYGKNSIKISEQPMCHSPGTLAMQVADNYADMFSLAAR